MKSYIKDVKEILNFLYGYVIPTYQRGFVWSPNNRDLLEKFLGDILNLSSTSGNYFLGTIITKEMEDTEDYEQKYLLDGQQRMTSILLVLKALYLKANRASMFTTKLMHGDGSPLIHHKGDDKEAFEEVMALHQLEHVGEGSFIGKTWNCIVEWTNKNFDRDSAEEKFKCIQNGISANLLILTDEDNAQLVFERLNYGGVVLTTGELLNVFLLGDNEREYYKEWYNIFDTQEAQEFWNHSIVQEGKKTSVRDKAIEKFLHAVARATCWKYKNHPQWTASDRLELIKDTNVYQTITSYVNRFGASKEDVAREICDYAKLYRRYFSGDVLNQPLPKTSCVERIACIIMATGWSAVTPYVLYVLKNVDSLHERNRIFDVLETYLMRLLICKNNGFIKPLSEFFAECLIKNEVLSADALQQKIMQITSSHHHMPSNEEIVENLASNNYKKGPLTLILYMLENKASASNLTGFNNYSATQLEKHTCWGMPLNVKEETRFKMLSATLSNHILINKSCKSQADSLSDSPLAAKADLLLDTTKWIKTSTAMLCSKEAAKWDIQGILERSSKLASRINGFWPVHVDLAEAC